MQPESKPSWHDRPIFPALPALTWEIALLALVIIAAIVTRFYDLGARVMSHDESLHTYFSWLLSKGNGYQHNPMMHGPFQFHIVALTYFIFGDNDFTSRVPAALFSIATVWMVWPYRRYIGKTGALVAALLMVISPYMLYYGRYVRNESFVAFSGVAMLYAVLRYMETRRPRYLYFLTLALVLHFTSKETAFIYTAQLLLFLAIYLVAQLLRKPWKTPLSREMMIIGGIAGSLLLLFGVITKKILANSYPEGIPSDLLLKYLPIGFYVLGALAFVFVVYITVVGYGWDRLREEPSFDLAILSGTYVLPMLSPFLFEVMKKISPERFTGLTVPTSLGELQALTTSNMVTMIVMTALVGAISITIGLLWNTRLWAKNALLFYSIFTVFYTTFFTNSAGFVTGLLGSLGYWIAQQEVARGGQPWYFYTLIQLPMYEFLPAIGSILAFILGVRILLRRRAKAQVFADIEPELLDSEPASVSVEDPNPGPGTPAPAEISGARDPNFPLTFALLLWWSVSSLSAFSYAGEKMPWLTVHITLPMILFAGWAIGRLIDKTDWASLSQRKLWLVLGASTIFVTSLGAAMVATNQPTPIFAGSELSQLQTTLNFIFPAIATIASGISLFYLLRDWTVEHILRVVLISFFLLLSVLTARAAFRASYATYDEATEYLVYAHGATPIKQVIAQARELSLRTRGDMSMLIYYDSSAPDTGVSWPFVWYLRDFTNAQGFEAPTRSMRESPFIIVDEKNFNKAGPVFGDEYYEFEYVRMWWPNQDYFYLTSKRYNPEEKFDENYSCRTQAKIANAIRPEDFITATKFQKWFYDLFATTDYSRICSAVKDPGIRAGLIDIWLNRDYTQYGLGTNTEQAVTLRDWSPSDKMRVYVRKDVAASIWNYGIVNTNVTPKEDPYDKGFTLLSADLVIGTLGSEPGQFNTPHGIAIAPDGTFYIADTLNHRIQRFSADGTFLVSWGIFGDVLQDPNLPGGFFNQPWDVAVGPDGSVYVSDTWNFRIQKFTSDGKFLTMWGTAGMDNVSGSPSSLYGPRGITVDRQGRVYVVDTGNKRVVVFGPDGNPITQFGILGSAEGELNEPVGIAIDSNGVIYITDTWNLRIQAFMPTPDGLAFTPVLQWDIDGWYGQGLENKPLIAIDGQGRLFVTDPEASRILQFDTLGQFVRTWGEYGFDNTQFGLASGVAVDAQGRVWVVDGGNHRIMRFVLPDTIAIEPSPSPTGSEVPPDAPSEMPSEPPSDTPLDISPTATQ